MTPPTPTKTTQHTPGPWTYRPNVLGGNLGVFDIVRKAPGPLARVFVATLYNEANARLIAAAPEMLRLLVRFSNVFAPDATGRPHPDLLNTKEWRLTLLEVRDLLATIEDRA